jgi:outer membrane protein TolC
MVSMLILEKMIQKTHRSSVLFFLFSAGLLIFHVILAMSFAIAAEPIPRVSVSLTLDQAVKLALIANRGIVTSRYNLENQRFSVDAAKSEFDIKILPLAGAGYQGTNADSYGNLGLGLTAQKKFDWGATGSVGPNVLWSGGDYGTGLNVSLKQPLLKGAGKDVNDDRIKSSLHTLDASSRTLTQTEINTVLDTIALFHDAIRQEKLIRMYGEMCQRLQAHADVARAKENVGLATPMDTYRAEIRLKDAETSRLQAVEVYQDVTDRLKSTLSISLQQEVALIAPVPVEKPVISSAEAVRIALAGRLELLQAEADIREAERKASVLKHNVLPELNLVFDYTNAWAMNNAQFGRINDTGLWGLRLESTTDLFRTTEKVAYQLGLLTLQSARINLETKKDEIRRQVRMQVTSLKELQERIALRKEQITQAEGKLALAQVKFSHGFTDNFNLIEAETELQSAKGNLLSAETEVNVGIFKLQAAMGILLKGN